MGAELEVVLSTVAENLDVAYALDGRTRDLTTFSGVVADSEDGRMYFEWDVVSLGDSYGVELTATSGLVHTHSVSYFTHALERGRYRPALAREDSVYVASTAERPAEADRVETAIESESSTDSDGVTDATTGAEVGATASDSSSSAGPWPDVGTRAGVESADSTADSDSSDAPPTDEPQGSAAATDVTATDGQTVESDATDTETDRESVSPADRLAELRHVATDTTRRTYIRENAIRQLPSFGADAEAVLSDLADGDAVTAEERQLAHDLLADLDSP